MIDYGLRRRLELFKELGLTCQIGIRESVEGVEGQIGSLTDREVVLKNGRRISLFDIEWVREAGERPR